MYTYSKYIYWNIVMEILQKNIYIFLKMSYSKLTTNSSFLGNKYPFVVKHCSMNFCGLLLSRQKTLPCSRVVELFGRTSHVR